MTKVGTGSKVSHPTFGLGVVVEISGDYYKIYFTSQNGIKEIDRSFDGLKITEAVAPDFTPIEISDIKTALREILEENSENPNIVPLGNKWINGTVTINSGDDGLKGKEIPVRTFFNKIIMVRDRLRVLEQNINSHKTLSEEEKVHLQQYITRAYGSLTTFNVLFAEKEDQFKGTGK